MEIQSLGTCFAAPHLQLNGRAQCGIAKWRGSMRQCQLYISARTYRVHTCQVSSLQVPPHIIIGSLGDKVLHKGGNRSTSLPLLLLLHSEVGVNVLRPKGQSQGAGEGVPQASRVTRQSGAVGGVGQPGHWNNEGAYQWVPIGSRCGLTEGQGSLSLWVAVAVVGLPELVEPLWPAGRAHPHMLHVHAARHGRSGTGRTGQSRSVWRGRGHSLGNLWQGVRLGGRGRGRGHRPSPVIPDCVMKHSASSLSCSTLTNQCVEMDGMMPLIFNFLPLLCRIYIAKVFCGQC